MSGDRERGRVAERAAEQLQNGSAGDRLVRTSGRVERPIPLRAPDHTLYGWFVPVSVGDQLASFFEFAPDLTLRRYATFQRHEGHLEGCPTAKSWTDSASIRKRLEPRLRGGENVRELFLTYDGVPSRIAWAATIESAEGTVRTLYVAGEQVWEAADGTEASF